MNLWQWSLALSSLMLVSSCSKPEVASTEIPSRPVKLFTVSNGQSDNIRQFPAVIEPTENARLTFRVAGRLTELQIRPGQQVKQGELLAKLDPTDFQLKADQAKARYQLAKAQFERANKLITQKLVSQAMFDETQAQLQVAEADLKTSETNLSYTELVAPFSGTIARLLVDNHENVAAQQAIMELQLRDMIDVVIQVPEDVIALVKKDVKYQPNVVFDSYPDHTYAASIKEWDTRADSATNSFKVVFSMPTPKEFNVMSGMTANVLADLTQFTRIEQHSLKVPATAVFAANNQAVDAVERSVWVFDEKTSTVKLRAVTIGKLSGQGLEILSGLDNGEQIVTAGVQQLREGQQVRPWLRERGL